MVFDGGDDAEALCVAVEGFEVGFLAFGQFGEVAVVVDGVAEPVLQGGFATMPEGGVADVVREAGGLDDLADVFGGDGVGEFLPFLEEVADHDAQRAADAGDFQRVHEPVVDVVVGGEGVGLCLAGEHPEGVGKEDAVVVLDERAACDVEDDACRVGLAVAY